VPDKSIIFEGLLIGLVATVALFLVDFFGLKPFFDFIPEGMQLFVLVFAAVYLRRLFIVRLNGKEII